jgi:hypothetical protein
VVFPAKLKADEALRFGHIVEAFHKLVKIRSKQAVSCNKKPMHQLEMSAWVLYGLFAIRRRPGGS